MQSRRNFRTLDNIHVSVSVVAREVRDILLDRSA